MRATIYIKDYPLWKRAQRRADLMGISMSEYIMRALQVSVEPPQEPSDDAKLLDKIRVLVKP